LEPKPQADRSRHGAFRLLAIALGTFLCVGVLSAPAEARGKHKAHRSTKHRTIKHHANIARAPQAPLQFPDSQYEPVRWIDIPGWASDDQSAGLNAFKASCAAIRPGGNAQSAGKVLGNSLYAACKALVRVNGHASAQARTFFESHFTPVRIARLGESDGFVTGYYEPVIEGSRTKTDEFPIPVYRKPGDLVARGARASSKNFPNKGPVYRRVGRHKLVRYYDRAEIEDGALDGRNLELCWVKNQTDVLFMQIQGSARIKLGDGTLLRLNYHAHNGFPYFPVGRELIDRGIVAKEDMSMQKIREWMDANPDAAKEVRRKNRSYVFFREVPLSAKDEPIGAQGVQLTPGRSIAVDKGLHVYGTPFFIHADLPLQDDGAPASFNRLVIAQDTGSAIIGPARADIYFGAGERAGKLSGRLRHNANFVMLIPKALDPVAAGEKMPLPMARPKPQRADAAIALPRKRPAQASAGSAAKTSPAGQHKK